VQVIDAPQALSELDSLMFIGVFGSHFFSQIMNNGETGLALVAGIADAGLMRVGV
jgi:hypothetical protein